LTLRTGYPRPAATGWRGLIGGLVAGLAVGVSLASAEPTYTIKKGDTLWSIAQRFQVPVDALQAANSLKPEASLQIGRTLIIPKRAPAKASSPVSRSREAASARGPEAPGSYIVQPGDYILKIAHKLGVSSRDLRAANHLKEDALLQIGQKLRVPAGERGRRSASPPRRMASPAPDRPEKAVKPPSSSPLPRVLYVSESRVHLRQGPSTRSPSLVKVPQGTRLKVLAQAGDWWKVVNPRGGAAYVAGWVVSSKAPETGEPPTASAEPAASEAASPPKGRPEVSPAPPDLPAWVYVKEERIHLRQGPATSSPSRGKLGRGTALKVLARQQAWWKVRTPRGQEGYVAGWVVTSQKPDPPDSSERWGRGFVLEARVPVRESPTTDARVRAYAARGQEVTILGESEDWYRVRLGQEVEGWVAAWKVRTPYRGRQDSQPEKESEPSLGRSLVRTALNYLGAPYRRGGSSSRGFDCSGFMCAVFRAYGIALPRTSRAMSRIGQPVSKGQLRFGDLVFFNTNGRGVSHVGMYIGNGQFVHASTWRRGVLVSSLNERYYRQRFAGARRILR